MTKYFFKNNNKKVSAFVFTLNLHNLAQKFEHSIKIKHKKYPKNKYL